MVNNQPSWGQFQRPQKSLANPNLPLNRNKANPEEEEEKIPLKLRQEQEEFPKQQEEAFEQEEKPKPEQPQWGQFQTPTSYQGPVDEKEQESTFGYFLRNITANASRLGEQVLGKYGNIEKMGKDILVNAPKTGGILGWAISELVGPENWERMVKGEPGKEQILPTSESLKEASIKATKGYTEPKTPGEKKFQEFTEDVGATLSGSRAATARNVAVNNLGIPAAANVVKRIVADNGFGEDKATIAKLGVWTALSLLGNVNGPRFASQLMNNGRNGIPNTLPIDVVRLQNRLQTVSRSPNLLIADPRTALARQEINAIQQDLANGQNSVRSLMTSYDGINAAKRNRGMFELNRNDQNFARRSIDEVRNAVRDEIMESGAQYPQALNNWRSGVQAWATIHQSRAITNWVQNLINGPYAKLISGPALGLFGISSYGVASSPALGIATAIAAPIIYKTGQVAHRVWSDPNLSRYYWNAILDAQNENLPAFLNNYNKLNKELKTGEKKTKSKKD